MHNPDAAKSGHGEMAGFDRGLVRYHPKLVYVLSGGAPRAFCHLGMIEALEHRGFRPDYIVGTSAGSLLGALYSHFGNVGDVYSRIEHVLASDEFEMFERKYFGAARPLEGHVQRGVKHCFSVLSETLERKIHQGISFVASARMPISSFETTFTLVCKSPSLILVTAERIFSGMR